MNTNAIRVAAAAVLGGRHQRAARNGQDAAAAWAGEGAGCVVVCDGCSAGASSEVGARLGAALVVRAIAERLEAGERPGTIWSAVRAEVAGVLGELASRLPGERAQAIHELFLFTIVAAAATRDEAAVWVLGDGSFSIDGDTQVLGPFADNQPPYLAYDLLDAAQPAHLVAVTTWNTIVIGTDGVLDLGEGLGRFAARRYTDHPDALRRELAVLARPAERIDWAEHRVVRTPARLQDDCAIGVLSRGAP